MPKKYRLTGEEIRKLSGKRIHGKLFTLLIAPIDTGHAKCAVVASKKTASGAVDRNKIKRRTRNALAKRLGAVKKSAALVFYAKRETKAASFAAIEADIAALLAKV